MEDENDLDNLFEEYENENATESTGEQQTEENTNTEENETARQVVPVPKRIVRNPRLKFNADRLCGERGIPVLTKHFKNVKFKGKGHEKEDLDKLMSTLEHWSHRLFPSMKFEACLKQIEKLGKKRAVQTCLVKIRRDMPILGSDFVHEQEEDERLEEENEVEFETPAHDAFDTLLAESNRDSAAFNVASTPTNAHSSGNALGTSFGGSLTEEQRKRMEYNKMLATERRKARMAAQQASSANEPGRSSPSIIDLDSTDNTTSNIEDPSVALSLDQQFDSMFGEASTSRNNDSILEDSEVNEERVENSKENGSEELGLDELMDLVDEEDSNNHLKKGSLSSGDKVAEAQDLDQQFESLLENTKQNGLNRGDSVESSQKNYCNSGSEEESLNQDSKQSAYESVDKDYAKNQGSFINYDSGKDNLETLREDCEESEIDSIREKSETTQCESMNKDVKKNQSDSASHDNNEELGLDELMDLVDE